MNVSFGKAFLSKKRFLVKPRDFLLYIKYSFLLFKTQIHGFFLLLGWAIFSGIDVFICVNLR